MSTWLFVFLGTLASALLHEAGHLLGALAFGADVRGIGLTWIGPYVHVRIWPPCRWRAVACLLSGPATNALLAIGCWGAGDGWETATMINVLLVAMNMVLPRSDGWQAWQVATGGRAWTQPRKRSGSMNPQG